MRLAASLLSLSFFFTLVASAQVLDQYKIGYGSDPYMTAINEAQPLQFAPRAEFGQAIISLEGWGDYGPGTLLATSADEIHLLQLSPDGTLVSTEQLISLEDTLTALEIGWQQYWRDERWRRLGDLDGDGRDELAIQSGSVIDILYFGENFQVKRHQVLGVEDLFEGDPPISDCGDALAAMSVTSLGDFDQDQTPDLVLGCPKNDAAGNRTGAVWIVLLNPNGSVKYRQEISSTSGNLGVTLKEFDRFGNAIVSPGDIDGDGVNDLVVGATYADEQHAESGLVFVLLLQADGTVKQTHKVVNTAVPQKNGFGTYLNLVGDWDEDGLEEVITGTTGEGVLLFLATDGTVRRMQTVRQGTMATQLGDLNKDGVIDLAIADDRYGTGTVAVVFLNADGTTQATMLYGSLQPFNKDDSFGYSLAAPGDLNQDGNPDLLVGAPSGPNHHYGPNSVWLLYLNTSGGVSGHKRFTIHDYHLDGKVKMEDQFGASVAHLGDLDGDGFPEIAVGAPEANTTWILFLNQNHNIKQAYPIILTNNGLDGQDCEECPDGFGRSLASLGDVDEDGVPDLVVGATPERYGGSDIEDRNAAVFVLFLEADGTVRTFTRHSPQEDSKQTFGLSMSALDDQDGDGLRELAVGAQVAASGVADEYATYTLSLNADGSLKSFKELVRKGPVATSLGDFNADGIFDVAIGLPFGEHLYGAMWMYQMMPTGMPGKGYVIDHTGSNGFTGELSSRDEFGHALAYLGDLNGDGAPEVAVGVPYEDDTVANRGAVWILSLDPAVLTNTTTPILTSNAPTLSVPFPNPFRHQASFTLTLPEAQAVRVEAFDLLGRRVAVLHEGLLAAGTAHRFTLQGSAWPSGLYMVRATGETFQQQQTVLRVR